MSLGDKMGKLNIYIMAMVVWLLLFNFAGLMDGGSTFLLRGIGILNPENFKTTQFYIILTGIFVVTLAGVIIGSAIFRDASLILLVKNVAIGEFLLFIFSDLLQLYNQIVFTNRYIALLIFVPLMLVYLLTLVEWVRGMSTW